LASLFQYGESDLGAQSEVCAVAVIYEDVPARDLAMYLSAGLAQKFQPDLAFDFTWWGFKYLSDPNVACEAAEAAAAADLILVAVGQPDDFPPEIRAWFESSLGRRPTAEGALVWVHTSTEASDKIHAQDAFLRSLAQRANLEYLPLSSASLGDVPAVQPAENLPLPHEAGPDRAREYPSSRWGINE